MTRNNVCSSLIVYGSWAPGGEKHYLISSLPEEWKKGIMLVGESSNKDDIHPGEEIKIEAWIIKFSDCSAELFTEEWKTQKRMLFDRWTELDISMGLEMERDQRSWWPENQEPIRGKNGQLVVNVYLPMKNFPHLKSMHDTPRPEDENDIKKLWLQQRSGEKKYDNHQFISLIKDCTFQECKELFNTLPDIELFLDKLKNLYDDMSYDSGYLLKQTDDGFYLYSIPKPEQAISSDQAFELVNRDIRQKCAFLESNEALRQAELLRNVEFKVGKPPESEPKNYETAEALEEVNEIINEPSYSLNDHWKYCLSEACYGIAANYAVRDFLISVFYKINYDFSLPYQLWKGGWSYKIHETTCYVLKM